jgi:hypothetical protein
MSTGAAVAFAGVTSRADRQHLRQIAGGSTFGDQWDPPTRDRAGRFSYRLASARSNSSRRALISVQRACSIAKSAVNCISSVVNLNTLSFMLASAPANTCKTGIDGMGMEPKTPAQTR